MTLVDPEHVCSTAPETVYHSVWDSGFLPYIVIPGDGSRRQRFEWATVDGSLIHPVELRPNKFIEQMVSAFSIASTSVFDHASKAEVIEMIKKSGSGSGAEDDSRFLRMYSILAEKHEKDEKAVSSLFYTSGDNHYQFKFNTDEEKFEKIKGQFENTPENRRIHEAAMAYNEKIKQSKNND